MNRSALAVVAVLGALGVAAVAAGAPPLAGPRDVVTKMRLEAARKEYVAGHADLAAKKLEDANKQCQPSWCSAAIKAEVLRDLAIVRVGGQQKKDEATRLFGEALVLDPKLSLPATLATKDVQAAFDAAQSAIVAKASASAAAVAAASAPPPPPPPPPPEPRPISSIGSVKWVPNVGFTEEQSGLIPAVAAPPTRPIVLEKPTKLGWSRQSLYVGAGQAAFAPNVKGFQPCDPFDAPGVNIGLDWDIHTPGTLVGHRVLFDNLITKSTAPERACGGLQKASVQSMSLGYGLDFHLPLPGILSGISVGALAMARLDLYGATGPAPKGTSPFSSSSSSDGASTSLDWGGRWGGHVRWRLGRPERGFHASFDLSRLSRWAPKHRADYLRYVVEGGYRWFGLYVMLEQRFHAVGGDPDVSTYSDLYARNNAIKSLAAAGVVFTF